MALYHRDMLKLYLTDVYAAELLCGYLLEKAQTHLSGPALLRPPPPPRPNPRLLVFVPIGVFFLFAGTWLLLSHSDSFQLWKTGFGLFFLLLGAVFVLDPLSDWLIYYLRRPSGADVPLSPLFFAQACRRSATLLKQIYAIDVIPESGRSLQAAEYLYHYFLTTGECDFGVILRTLPKKEDFPKDDDSLTQEQRKFLRQRHLDALLERYDRQPARKHQKQLRHLARTESDPLMRRRYFGMLRVHRQVSAFFAEATYLCDSLN